MKIFLLLTLLAVVPSARADVSDSGNLSIGGNGVIAGTMTVQGSAFSVGGSSFTLSGGSATLAYQIIASSISLTGTGSTSYDLTLSSGMHFTTANTGITWGDGSVSTSASAGAGGSGNVVLNATQTFSGANTFTSSVTFNGAVLGSIFSSTQTIVSPNSDFTMNGPNLTTVTGSTVTITLNTASRLHIHFTCSCLLDYINIGCLGGALVDGALIDGETRTHGIYGGWTNSSYVAQPIVIDYLTTSTYTAGNHTVALLLAGDSNDNVTLYTSKGICKFWVEAQF